MRPEAIICSLCGGRHLPVQCRLGQAIIESARWESTGAPRELTAQFTGSRYCSPQAEDIRVEAA